MGNWEEVLKHWKKTSEVRMNLFGSDVELNEEEADTWNDDSVEEGNSSAASKKKKGKKKATTPNIKKLEQKIKQKAADEYMAKYPAFHENTGYMLVSIVCFPVQLSDII